MNPHPLLPQVDGLPPVDALCVHELFVRRARAAPDAVALVHGDRWVSYRKLDAASDILATRLLRLGLGRGALVGLTGERSPELVASLLAILKAGAAYVPLDPNHPADTTRHILADARIGVVVTTMAAGAWSGMVRRIHVVSLADDIEKRGGISMRATPADVAAVVYTSGSTGSPKGVVLTHRAVATRVRHARRYYGEREVIGFKSSIGVVAHLAGLMMPLISGFTVVIIDDDSARNVATFAATIIRAGITRVGVVPSYLRTLLDTADGVAALRRVSTVIVSGEPLKDDLVRHFRERVPDVSLVNSYGLTETSGAICSGEVNDARSIGAPEADGTVVILDDEGNPTSPGGTGQVCVRGSQLARGYLYRPMQTAERWVPDAGGASGERLFLTGDIGYSGSDGITLLGRHDAEVKVRGFRVNLRELEQLLEGEPGIRRAHVLLDDSGRSHAVLRAFLVPSDNGSTPDVQQLRGRLAVKIPAYALPASFDVVAELPQLPNGKIDRQALRFRAGDPAEQTPVVSWEKPQSLPQMKRLMESIWSSEFGVTRLSLDDDFFALGGDSLTGMRILSRINVSCGVSLELADVFDHPTVAMLSQRTWSLIAPAMADGDVVRLS